MKKNFFLALISVLAVAVLLHSCSGGGNPGGSPASGTTTLFSKTAIISGTVSVSSSAAGALGAQKVSYAAAKKNSRVARTLSAAGVKKAVELPPLINATIKLYNADRPDWIYPVAQVFTDSQGKFKFETLTNADLNREADGDAAYKNGDSVPAGNYTIIATNDTTISGGKQLVAVQTFVKYFEGAVYGNDLVVQDSDALPAVSFLFGRRPNGDGTFGGAGATLAPNAGIQVIFDMAMARLSVIDAVKVYAAGSQTPVPGAWKFTPDLLTATFYPTGGLAPDTGYTVAIQGGEENEHAAVNVYGKPLPATVTGAFTSEAANDTTPPQNLVLYKPTQTNVAITTPIQIASPEPIDINTIGVAGSPSIGDKPSIQYIGTKPVMLGQPDYYIYEIGHTPLSLDTNYNITISTVRDMAGNQISPLTFTFKTEAASAGVTGAAGTQTRADQVAVKDVFGKWINAMNARNAALLTTYMTGDFFWLTNGWSGDDENHDGRLNLTEFRKMLEKSFTRFDSCGTIISGDTSDIAINGASAGITFTLTFTNTLNLTDPACASEQDQTKYAELDNINGAWLISRGSDYQTSSYPPPLEAIELKTPANGTTFPEPTPSKPLNPDFVWTAVSGVKTYALLVMEKGSSEKGYVALIDASSYAAGDQVTFTYTSAAGYSGTSYVMPSGGVFGFTKNISQFLPGGYYVWSVLGFKTATVADFELAAVTDPAADLGASSSPDNFSVANNAPPSVISVEPANTATNISTSPTLTAVFSEAMDATTIDDTTFTLATQEGASVAGTVAYDSATYTATFVPAAALDYETNYVARITTGVKDIAANSLAVDYSWGFTTEDAPDTTEPVTTATPPGGTYNSSVNVSLSANETVQFILYTTDPASSPTTTYTSPISLTSPGGSIKFYAVDLAGNQESVKTETYVIDSGKPITNITPPGGYFNTKPVVVSMTTETGAKIYYTTDGSEPTTALTPYTSVTTSLNSTGTNQLRFFAVDSAGNAENIRTETYIIDEIAPDTIITTNPDNPTRSKFANFTFTSNETDVTFECRVNSGSWAACTSPYSQQLASEGTYTFSARAKDRAANYDGSPAIYSWTYDITPPTGSIGILDLATMATGPTTTSTAVKLQISAADSLLAVDQMQISNDGQAWYDPVTYTTLVDWTLSSGDGTKAAFVRFKDAAGNWSGPYSDTIVLDQTPPDTSFTQTPPSVSSSTTNNTFSFTATEPVAGFECSLDNGGFASCASPINLVVSEATHTFLVRAVDVAGLTDPTPASYSWKVDTTALITTASPVGGNYNLTNTPVNVTLTPTGIAPACSSPAPITYYCLGSGCNPTNVYTVPIQISAEGSTTLRYYSVEQNGGSCGGNNENESATTGVKQQLYNLDLTAPTVNITSYPTGTIASSSATFYFSASETATVYCRLDGGSYSTCVSPMTYTGLTDGSHTFYAYAIDTAGNSGAGTPSSKTWGVDLSAPTGGSILIDGGTVYSNDLTLQLTLTASDTSGVAYVLLSNDGTSWYSYSWTGSPMTITSWSLPAGDGARVVYARFQDSKGNTTGIYSDSITVDTVLPNTTISSAPASPTTSRGVYFYFYASESATFECSVDGGAYAVCSSPYQASLIYDGTHTFSVRAKDNSGQYDPTPASYTWTLFTGYWDSPGVWDWSNWGN